MNEERNHQCADTDDNTVKQQRPDKRDLLNRRKTGGPVPPRSGKPGGKPGWPLGHRIAFIILLVMLSFFLWKQMSAPTADYAKVTYTRFDELVEKGVIEEARLRDGTFLGKLEQPMQLGKEGDERMYTGIEVEIGDYDQQFTQSLVDRGIDVTIEPERTWMTILINTLPWILIFGIWLFILRQMQGGQKGVFSFGKSRAKLMADNQPKVTFKDVAGVAEAKEELNEIIEFLKSPKRFQRLGGKIPKGALLVGPPGTGKTLLARAVAGEAGVPFFSMSGSDFVEMFVGVGASRVRDLFEQGKSNAPCILFIDEIDAVGRQRGAGIGGGHDEREQTLNQLLVEMDGFESNEGVILLAATNRPDVLDPALLRPGRFDRQIVVDWPDVNAREQILKVHSKKIKVSSKVDMSSIARGTPGMTGADLANVVNEAALLAARLNRQSVTMADFEEAKDKVMMGTARKTLVINEDEKKLTAYHEAGHVLVAKFVENADPVHKVSIIARGRALGLTHFLPTDEKHNWSYNYCLGKLTVLLGGRAAEMIKFGDITNGAANDIDTATKLARKMVCEWGMSRRLGPLAFGKKDNEVFLGREIATHKDYSEETAVAIDQEVRTFVEKALQKAESIIRQNPDKLENLTAELLRREVLAGDDIDRILKGDGSPKKRPGRKRRSRSKSSRSKNASGNGDGGNGGDSSKQKTEKTVASTSAQSGSDSGGKKEETKDDQQKSTKRSRSSRRRRPRKKDTAKDTAKDTGNDGKSDSAAKDSGNKDGGSGQKKDTSGKKESAERQDKAASDKSDKKDEGAKSSGSSRSRRSRSRRKPSNKKKDDSNNKSGGSGKSSGSKKKSSKSRQKNTGRSRMIRLKTGGRQRTIRKAPAKKIRNIN